MKRSCLDCRALSAFISGEDICRLNYPIKMVEKRVANVGKMYFPAPKEQCPKPKTYGAYFQCAHFFLQVLAETEEG